MGLAPYGKPRYVDLILSKLVDLKDDGTFRLNMDYFNFATGLTMTNGAFAQLFGATPRSPEAKLTQHEMDLARSIQDVTEEVVLRLARTVRQEVGVDYLCMAGGVALNCVANGRVLRESGFRDLWIQPAAGDAGCAIGAALSAWHEFHGQPRSTVADQMHGAYLGPKFSNDEIRDFLDSVGAPYERLPEDELCERVARMLAAENVIGWFQGRMEFGPRALGNRSIIGDARSPKMQSVMNLKIKYRESFRPFAPVVLDGRVSDYFELDRPSPYMMIVAPVRQELRLPENDQDANLFGIDKLNVSRSTIPAVTHVDYSARIQTIHAETNPRFYQLLKRFEALTGVAVLVNTSFNVRGDPLVCSPADAYRCFMRTEMDYLVLENYILAKPDQPSSAADPSWVKEFELD
jgi:carbamoyltransferase